jgi:hypothetical protein
MLKSKLGGVSLFEALLSCAKVCTDINTNKDKSIFFKRFFLVAQMYKEKPRFRGFISLRAFLQCS